MDVKQRTTAPEQAPAYDYEDDLNYRDDGDALGVASYNDVYRGYELDPYLPRQWASTEDGHRLCRRAVREVVNAPANVEELADYVLMLWDRLDGTLQDFFDAFTVRYNNNLKRALANAIQARGYTVYPLLLDDRALYAARLRRVMRTAAKRDPAIKLRLCAHAFVDSEGLQLCLGEVDDLREMGLKVTAQQVLDLVDYYVKIFPEDYALALTKDYVDGKQFRVAPDRFQDYNLTDESLSAMERMLNGNQDPYYPVHNGGGGLGWDYVTDMRGFDGVRPEQYELPATAAVKKKRFVTADVVGNVPLYLALDAVGAGCREVARVNHDGFAAPPRHVRTVRVQRNRAESHVDDAPAVIDVNDELMVYEVWSVTMASDMQEQFLLISAKCTLLGSALPKWSDAEYRGSYGSASEAVNAVGGYVD